MENKIPKRSNIDMFFRNYSNFNQLAGKYFKSSIQESKKQLIQLYERVFTHLIVNKFIKEKLSNSDLEKILLAENNIGECPSIANKMSKYGMKKSAEIFKKYQNEIEFVK